MPQLGLGLGLHRANRALFRGLLDQYAGAAAAYSLRALSSGWLAGDVVEVRRSSDSTTQGFTANQVANGDLVAFCGVGDGFVSKWYDQSGNGKDATQITTTAQPKIVSAGVLVTGGLQFDGVDDGLKTSAALTNAITEASAFIVSKNDVATGQRSMFRIRPNAAFGSADGFLWEQGATTATTRYSGNTAFEGSGNAIGVPVTGVGTQDTVEHLNSFLFQQSQILAYEDSALDQTINSVLSGSVPIGSVTLINPLWIGFNFDSSDRAFNGQMSELIIYPTDQSANRTGIEANINDFYSIY